MTEAEFTDHLEGVREQLWASRVWDVQRDTPKLRITWKRLAENSDFWPTVSRILSEINNQTAYLSPAETQLLLADTGPVQLGDFGELLREAIRRLPRHGDRLKLLGMVMSDTFTYRRGYSLEERKAERFRAVQQILDMHPRGSAI